MSDGNGYQTDATESSDDWRHDRRAAFHPPSDFYVNVQSGLRTAMSTGFAFLWMGKGPFQGGLSFFAGVTAIVALGKSAGETIDRTLEMTHGAVIGCVCAFLPRVLMDYGAVSARVGFFLSIFLVTRSRRLTSLGKKFGCMAVTLLAIAKRDEGLPTPWIELGMIWLRTHVEGGICAVGACLLPYPKFATRDCAWRAQFMCRSLSAAVKACVTDFIKGRDEGSIIRARLLCEQVRNNLAVARRELEWSRLELGLLCGGCCVGGMRSADALEEVVEILEQVLRGVRGMRQGMSNLLRSRAQASFAEALGPSLKQVANAVNDVLEMTPNGLWLLGAGVGDGRTGRRLQQRESLHSTLIHDEFGDKVDSGKVESHLSTIADASAEPETANNDDLGTRGLSYRARSKFHREAVAQLNHAVAVMMIDYNNARKAILYGLDEHCRPLEESSRSSSPPAAEVAQAILENNCDVDEVEGGESDGEGSRHRQEHEVLDVGGAGLSACDLGMGSVVLAAGLMLSHSDCGRVSLEMSPSLPRARVSFQDLAAVAKPRTASPTRKPAQSPLPPAPPADEGDCDDPAGVSTSGDNESHSRLLEDDSGGSFWGDGTEEGGATASNEDNGVPNHLLVMQEREKLGSMATMARGAFLLSLVGMCRMLTQDRNNLARPRGIDLVGAVQYFLRGLWIAFRPPPGIPTASLTIARFVSKHALGIARRCCCCRNRTENEQSRRDSDRLRALRRCRPRSERFAEGQDPAAPPPGGNDDDESSRSWCWSSSAKITRSRRMLSSLSKGDTFWAFKVSLALTLCALFPLSGFLSDVFEPALWIPVTAAFVMADKHTSAASVCLMRLVGTVLGAVYGILAAKLLGSSHNNPYSWEGHAVILPWVAITCFFRNSASFAHAALVAAFTAVVMFTGASTVLGADGETVSLARITNTVIGISIYLIIDLLLVPTRASSLIKEEIYIALDAALNEVCINGERLFSKRVCPCESRLPWKRTSSASRVDAAGDTPVLIVSPPVPSLSTPSSAPLQTQLAQATRGPSLYQRGCRRRRGPVHSDERERTDMDSGFDDRHGKLGAISVSARPSLPQMEREKKSRRDEGVTWGRALLVVRAGGSGGGDSGGGGQFASEEKKAEPPAGEAPGAEPHTDVGVDSEALQTCEVKVGGSRGAVAVVTAGGVGLRQGGDIEEGKSDLLGLSDHSAVSGLSMRLADAWLLKLVSALDLQKHYLPVAEFEPQLWFPPFPASAYHEMISAQEELLRALSLMSRASTAIAEDRSRSWRVSLRELGTNLAALVQLLKAGLENARDVFRPDGDDGDARGWKVRKTHEEHLLEVQAETARLDSIVNTDFVNFIESFLKRGAFPDMELESILRINTAIYAVMGLQRALLTLGYAVATVVDRESFCQYYGC